MTTKQLGTAVTKFGEFKVDKKITQTVFLKTQKSLKAVIGKLTAIEVQDIINSQVPQVVTKESNT